MTSWPSTAEVERILRAIHETHSDQRLRATAVGVVSEKLNGHRMADLRQWNDSPAGREIAKLEEAAAAASGDPQAVVQQGAARLAQAAPPRRQLLEELLTETRAAEALTRITINTALAAQRGAASVLPQAPALSAAQVKAAIESQRPQKLKVFGALALAGFAKAYQT